MSKEKTMVLVGDEWQDLDPRTKGQRIVKVVQIEDGVAVVKSRRGAEGPFDGPRSKIRLDRFVASTSRHACEGGGGLGKKGFVLVSRIAGEEASAVAEDIGASI